MGISIGQAVRKTAAAKGISTGQALTALVDAGESGKIRARWSGYYLGGSPPIPRHEFLGASIDEEKDVLILANGERTADVYLDEADFAAWLSAQMVCGPAQTAQLEPVPQALPDGDPKRANNGQGGKKAALILGAAAEIYPNDEFKDLPPQTVFERIGNHIQRTHSVIVSKTHTLRTLRLKT